MVYCPKCHSVVSEIICPVCSTDIFNYKRQETETNSEHLYQLRSDHRIMEGLKENQEYMKDILEDGELNNDQGNRIFDKRWH